MTVKTDYGWLVVNGTSLVRLVRLDDSTVLAGDWHSADPHDGMKTYREAERLTRAENMSVVVTLDSPDLEGFYRKRGFTTAAMRKTWDQ